MKIQTITLFAFILLIGLSSCDNQPRPDHDLVVPPPVKGAVWVVNEGNFQSGNSSLTILNIGENKLYQNVFESANSRSLGDVFQSVNIFNGRAYLVVNNSQKIEVIHPTTYKSIATISGFTSPRYILQIDATRAYVSEYYANALKIVDLTNNVIIGSIPMAGLLEEMVMVKNKVYITNARGNFVYVVDPANNTIIDSVKTVYSSNSIQVDSASNVWVLSNGDPDKSILPSIQRINTDVDTVDRAFSLGMSEKNVTRLCINTKRNRLYWLSRHVYSMKITDQSVSTTPLINALDRNFYGLGVNPYDNQIYTSDARDFVQQSTIIRYSQSGVYLGEFKAGLIAGDFYFYYP
jgi:DNA-binding beta-propeller fold protein YncE